ncbi:MAG: hypothetical protein Q8Q01_03285 [archaeon]|nr:hypothetical protein [archaeon]
MVETRKGLVLNGVLFLIVCLGLVQIIRTTQSTTFFFFESLGLLFLMFLILLGFVGAGKEWGRKLFLTIFILYALNLVVVWWLLRGSIFGFLVVIAVLGIIINISKRNSEPVVEEVHSMVFDEPKDSKSSKSEAVVEAKVVELKKEKKSKTVKESKPVKEKLPKTEKTTITVVEKKTEKKTPAVSVKHSPGKFVASKNSNVYHVPKCEWAKKIAPIRQVWFMAKENAWEKGLKAHSCVE